jgi:hypothetical protein
MEDLMGINAALTESNYVNYKPNNTVRREYTCECLFIFVRNFKDFTYISSVNINIFTCVRIQDCILLKSRHV